METYSPARVSQLRAFLIAAGVVGVVMAALGVLSIVEDGADRLVVLIMVAAALGVAAAVVGLRLLPERSRRSQAVYACAGLMQVLMGLLLASGVLGILPSIVGVLLVMLALLADTGERQV